MGVLGAIEEAAKDDGVWIICLTGTNDAFCSGLDLRGAGESHNPQSAQTKYLDEFGWVSRFLLTTRKVSR